MFQADGEPICVKQRMCVGLCAIPEVDVAGSNYVAIGHTMEPFLTAAFGGCRWFARLPTVNLLTEIRDSIESQRGKPTRKLRRVTPDGMPTLEVEVQVRGKTLKVANILWPIHFPAEVDVIQWVLNELRAELLPKAGAASTACLSPSPSDSPDQAEDAAMAAPPPKAPQERTSKRARPRPKTDWTDCAEEIDSSSLPVGVFFAPSLPGFIVRKRIGPDGAASKGKDVKFRFKLPTKTDDVEPCKVDIVLQARQAALDYCSSDTHVDSDQE